jgi:hypothetical protein
MPDTSTTADLIATVAAAISFGSAAVSVLAIYIPWKNTHDSEVFREAVQALERAYRALTLNGLQDGHPIADRLNWLTCARHLQSYKALRDSLKTALYLRLSREHEEHWRHEFYLCLLKNRIYQPSYFSGAEIEPRSAIVIFGFAAWPNSKEDPIDKLDFEAIFQESELLKGNHGLQQYLQNFPEFGGSR